MAVLRLDSARAEIKDPASGAPITMTRPVRTENPDARQVLVDKAINNWLNQELRGSYLVSKQATGDLSIIFLGLGWQNELGWICAASDRADFPTEIDRLLLSVSTNQAAIALQEARLWSEQKRVARELDEKVAERTQELQELKDQLQRENVMLREQVDEACMFEEIVGTAPVLRSVLSRVAKVAPTDCTVMITGETGTGKELIARAMHKRSTRSVRAFVKVNCAAIPVSLIASELFGHEKGAFTGALQRRLGRFELAQGGTLFLDEIGELPAEVQVSLLRVLQEREFERVGGTQVIQADVRVIAATNRDLKTAVSKGLFRQDLYYRLNVFPIEMPSLRERPEDIALLTEYFIQRYAQKLGKAISGISKKTLDQFRSYSWPGNIRELQNVIERSLILCEKETFSVDENWLNHESVESAIASKPLGQRLVADERASIEAALAKTTGRVAGKSGAAAILGVPASTLESRIRSLRINKYLFKTG
ncbi:MAG: sigma-54-dependent Fis family transcriptional regulator [Verrucomicrobia bacterium]|nr:sigma-54-dependent Fis family transcriptional regulator [Verrucomicrobiota bacterium]